MPNFCSHGGTLVSGDRWVATDSSEHSHWSTGDVVGCNNLRCRRCGEAVRNATDVRPAREGRPEAFWEILAATEDWTSLPWIEPAPTIRLYACSCYVWTEAIQRRTAPPDWEDGDPVFPWRCAGHPVATLPLEMDGLTLDEATDLGSVVAPVLAGRTPAGARKMSGGMPVAWLCRLYTRLAGLPQADQVALAISRGLTGADGEIGEALAFYERFPRAAGFEAVLRLAEEGSPDRSYPFLVFGSPYDRSPVDALGSRLRHAGAEPDEEDRAAGRILREQLLAGNKVVEQDHLLELVIVEAEWVTQNILQLVDGRPARVPKLLDALHASGRTELLTVAGIALATGKTSVKRRLREWLRENPYDETPWAFAIAQSLKRR